MTKESVSAILGFSSKSDNEGSVHSALESE